MRSIVLSVGILAGLAASHIARAEEFPQPYNSEPASAGDPMPADKAAAGFRVPDGFKVNVFASEPEVRNPIAMSWDARGRLWIAENYTYAERPKKIDFGLRDRIIILADEDGDGRSDRRTVFADDVQNLTSIEWDPQGVWLMCPPQLLFIPNRNGDDKPDGPAEVVLDGFEIPAESFHNFANGLRWGPDGWLYGRCGASAPGQIGTPGTPAEKRVPLRGTMWRYHPTRKTFEALCHGTTNPWGHDWNEHGELFFVNTVNGHLWHMIPGAHFVRPHTIDPNPRVYEAIDMHADHWHWDTSKTWADSRKVTGEHDRRGGGHAHSGAMIYLAEQWPADYRGRLFTLNLHGRRVNDEQLERHGSGYVAHHNPDILFAADPWFRGIDLSYGPDGSVFILDWSDTGECHEATGVHRSSGRIYRVTYGEPKPVAAFDLARKNPAELVELHRHGNEWFSRQARRQLVTRAATGDDLAVAIRLLTDMCRQGDSVVVRLRALWSLYALNQADAKLLESLLSDRDEHVRTWAVRLLTDTWPLDSIMGPLSDTTASVDDRLLELLAKMAHEDNSGLVRLALGSTIQRLPVAQRAALASELVGREEDAADQNLPPLVWYGLIPLADRDPQALVPLAQGTKWSKLRIWIARRLAEDLATRPEPMNNLLAAAAKDSRSGLLTDSLAGMTAGLAGWHKAPQPTAWADVQRAVSQSGTELAMTQVRDLSVLFGDGRALDEVRSIALDKAADMNQRRVALETLIQNRPANLRQICEKLLNVRFLNAVAARGLAQFNDPAIGVKMAQSYKTFHQSERGAVIEALVSRPAFAAALLDEMAKGKINRNDLSAFQARQIRSFNDPKLARQLAEVWGEVHDSSADKKIQMVEFKSRLTPEVLAKADAGQGRVVFNAVCANCHRLYGHGGQIGPDLTGAGRQNIDYLLSNMVDPSAMVAADFRMSVVVLADGRVLNGIIRSQNARTVTLQTAKEQVAIDRGDIETSEVSTQSLMPDGLLQPLKPDQLCDLVGYLMTRSQVALPDGAQATADVSRSSP